MGQVIPKANIGIALFSSKNAIIRSKNKDWVVHRQDITVEPLYHLDAELCLKAVIFSTFLKLLLKLKTIAREMILKYID